jgi:hypothetical protein
MKAAGGQVCSRCCERKGSECFYKGRKQCKDCFKKIANERADKLKGGSHRYLFIVFGYWLLVSHLKLCLTSHFDHKYP